MPTGNNIDIKPFMNNDSVVPRMPTNSIGRRPARPEQPDSDERRGYRNHAVGDIADQRCLGIETGVGEDLCVEAHDAVHAGQLLNRRNPEADN